MSPETVGNKPYNFKSDVWSLGCILYEMTTFHHPFNARDLRSLFIKIMRGVYSPIPYNYGSKLRQLVAKLLTTTPHKRPDVDETLGYSFVQKHASKYVSACFSNYFYPASAV